MELYYKYSQFLKNKYGVKTYKLPVNLPLTCPNRDGFLSENGCAFCGESGGSFENSSAGFEVREQLLKNRDRIGKKYNAEKFIAYFQNFTNTYLPLEKLKRYVSQGLDVDKIVEIALATRPDCINEYYISHLVELLDKAKQDLNLTLELGLQTANYHTLQKINRGHTLAEFIDAVQSAKKYNAEVGVHLILNLPGDDLVDVKENAKLMSALGVDTVKLHALYIRKGTRFAQMYSNNEFEMISLDEYIDRVIKFLEYLDPDIAVQRLLGRAPREETLFVNWDMHWNQVHNKILKIMKERETYQGKKFNYLQGKALKRFE
jgi:hypothetical protein